MKKSLMVTILSLICAPAFALGLPNGLSPLAPEAPPAPETTNATLYSFRYRNFRLDSISINAAAFKGSCNGTQFDESITSGPDEEIAAGDFFPVTGPEFCPSMNFNYIKVIPKDLEHSNDVLLTLGVTEYAQNREFAKWQAKDSILSSSATYTATCVNRRVEELLWIKMDLLDCTLPNDQGVVTLRIL